VSGQGSGPRLALEDFQEGQRRTFGPRVLTREEIVAFARDWDPQPFHLDEAAAARSPFGGLIASGWQTAALCMRLVVDGMLADSTSIGSPGLDELRWLKPVRPGDALSVEVTLLEVTPSRSKPDRGSVKVRYHCTNQTGEAVMTMVARILFLRRGATREA
jgi:acyl dehydratase